MGTTAALETDRRLRLTRKHVYALLNAGLLGDGRYELLSGELIQKMPQNKPHVNALRRTLSVFEDTFGRDIVGSQSPVIIDETNEPEPDVFLVRAPLLDYPDNPEAGEVLLLVEISDSTLRVDRTEKMVMYGSAGIPEYWVLDVNRRRLIVHREPQEDGYGSIETMGEDSTIVPLAAPDASILVSSLLP